MAAFLTLQACLGSDLNETQRCCKHALAQEGCWLTCVVQNPRQWGESGRKKWSGLAHSSSDLKQQLGAYFKINVSLVQYFDEQHNSYIDLEDEFNSWSDFVVQPLKRVSIQDEPDRIKEGNEFSNILHARNNVGTLNLDDLQDQEEPASDLFEGDSVKQVD
eukprot:749774-Hanusia_phi.AAC.2